jgi:uncharacterized membrane-anchored protein
MEYPQMFNKRLNLSEQMRLIITGVMAVIILGFINIEIAGKERIISEGTTMLLRIAPRDPRSLMQGDYMALRYSMAREVAAAADETDTNDGSVIVSLRNNEEAVFVALYKGQSMTPGQHLLQFRKRGESVRLASDAFFFEEGQWQTYSGARFGEIRVDDEGSAVLIALRDAEGVRMGPALH